MDHDHHPSRPVRCAWLLAGLVLVLGLLACSAEPEPGRRAPRRERPGALQPPPAPSAEAQRIEACVERGVHGPGYDELPARDVRRKLRRLQVRAECEAPPGR